MTPTADQIAVLLEIGAKRVFAVARDWPGWCRAGRDEESALRALAHYGERYARVVQPTGLSFTLPTAVSAFVVSERLAGNASTDFGAPAIIAEGDAAPVDENELSRLQRILGACWSAFDAARASGATLRSGPRGGGRDLMAMTRHIIESDAGYLGAVGWKAPKLEMVDLERQTGAVREAILAALASSARGEIPRRGPRGGQRWPARYFTRRVAWHVLDHVWEIEDRTI